MNKDQKQRYRIVEKNNKIKLEEPKDIKLNKKWKFLILAIMYLLCNGAIVGLIFAILY